MLLASLLHTLSAEEIARIRAECNLPERSRLIFERVAAAPKSPPTSAELCKAFRISTNNLYRLFSEIVDECVRVLAPMGEFETLKFFQSKFLYRPFVTEFRQLEKRFSKAHDRDTLERLYEYVFVNMRNFVVSDLDFDLMEEVGRKWHKSKYNPPYDDDLNIRMKVIFARIASLPAKKKLTMTQMSAYANAMLEALRDRASRSRSPLARESYYQAEWKACIFDRADHDRGLRWLSLALETVRKNRSEFDPKREEVIELQIAFDQAHDPARVSDSLAIFRKYYRGQTVETASDVMFVFRFCQVAFLARDFAMVRELIEVFQRSQVSSTTPGIAIMRILLSAKLELVDGTYEAAATAIDAAKTVLSDHFFLAHDLQVRALETALVLRQGDLVAAEQLVRRNIKWLHTRKVSLSKSSWIHYYNVIGGIIVYRQSGKLIRSALLRRFRTEFGTERPDFYAILEPEVREMVSGKGGLADMQFPAVVPYSANSPILPS